MNRSNKAVPVALAFTLTSAVAATASAQTLQVIPVPWVALDPAIAHQAYNGHATTFKAIARGGNGTYTVDWDFDGDGTYEFSESRTNRYDLSTRHTYPDQTSDITFVARVRVTSNGETVVGSYPVRVYADVPSNPAAASARQLQLMRNVAVDDALWFVHNQMNRTGDENDPVTGAQISGSYTIGSYQNQLEGLFLEALGRNQHYAAFPAAYIGEMPNPSENAARWASDPYAEDATRMVNRLLYQATVVFIPAADESNLTGFYPETAATPITGTDDGIAVEVDSPAGSPNTGSASAALRGFAVSRLTGFVAQMGDLRYVLGRRFEYIVQQMVDGLAWAQSEFAGNQGSWYYTPNVNSSDLLGELGQGTMDAAEALWQAEQSMRTSGVIVPNAVKARLAEYIRQNANNCPLGGTGGSWSSMYNGVCDFSLSAAHVFSLGWLGANRHPTSDTRLAFPGYSGLTFAQLRSQYDSSLVFMTNAFHLYSAGAVNWDEGFVEGGDFNRTDGLGDHWSMVHWARASRAVEPEITTYGTDDYARLFATYLINNQAADGGWNWTFSSALQSYSDRIMGPTGRALWAVHTLTPDELQPVVSARATPTNTVEGGTITFAGLSTQSGTFSWNLGNGDSGTGTNFTYLYPDDGNFTATLTVTTPGGATATATIPITITNAAPVTSAGPDLTVNEGDVVAFAGTVTDPGVLDTHTVTWDFGDSQTANTRTASHAYADNGTFAATFTAIDNDSAMGTDSATITVRNVAPTITSTAPTTANEGTPYAYTLTFTDPGSADTQVCSARSAPAGATLTGCTLTWTPTLAQAAAPAFSSGGTHPRRSPSRASR